MTDLVANTAVEKVSCTISLHLFQPFAGPNHHSDLLKLAQQGPEDARPGQHDDDAENLRRRLVQVAGPGRPTAPFGSLW